MFSQLPGYAYNGYSLASGGIAGEMHRARLANKAAADAVTAWQEEVSALRSELLAGGMALPDANDLFGMVLFRELTPGQAREWAAEMKTARPWYAQ